MAAAIQDTGRELRRIVRTNEEIKSVVATAFKINLMAMNAVFLAKRAGQTALGFGVLSNEFDPRKIQQLFASHQYPDIISSLSLWLEFNPAIKCHVCRGFRSSHPPRRRFSPALDGVGKDQERLVQPRQPARYRDDVPQHGAIYRGEQVRRFIDWFARLEVGTIKG